MCWVTSIALLFILQCAWLCVTSLFKLMMTHNCTGWRGNHRRRDMDAAQSQMTLSLAATGAGWRTAPFLWQLPPRADNRGKRAAPLYWNKTRLPIFRQRGRIFRGCEASPRGVSTCTGHSPLSQRTAKRWCCDKPETNWHYYVSKGSVLCYIRGQGVSDGHLSSVISTHQTPLV